MPMRCERCVASVQLRSIRMNHLLDPTAVHSLGFAGQAEYLAHLVQPHLCPGHIRAQHIAEVERVLTVAVEIRTHQQCQAATRFTIARYLSTGKSKLCPLKVTSCGRS